MSKKNRREHDRRRGQKWEQRSQRTRDRYQQGDQWVIEAQKALSGLAYVYAPEVDAAGSLDQAIKSGVLPNDPWIVEGIKMLMPVARGGFGRRAEAEGDWKQLVDDIRATRASANVEIRIVIECS